MQATITSISDEPPPRAGDQDALLSIAVPDAAGPGLALRRAFPGEDSQVHEARAWAGSVVPPCRIQQDVQTVTAELARNAIRHTASGDGGRFTVEITPCRDVIRVAVADAGGPAEPDVPESPRAEESRGLHLVRTLSWRMGVTGGRLGRVVWAEVAPGGPEAGGTPATCWPAPCT